MNWPRYVRTARRGEQLTPRRVIATAVAVLTLPASFGVLALTAPRGDAAAGQAAFAAAAVHREVLTEALSAGSVTADKAMQATARELAYGKRRTIASHRAHLAHLAHRAHLARLRARQAALAEALALRTPPAPRHAFLPAPRESAGRAAHHRYRQHAAAPPARRYGSAQGLHGTLGCAGLEALWRAAGGSAGAAFTAASIAMAESGGNQYAHSPTDDFGYWQINGSHGAMASYDPMTNARAAVSISGDGANWSPWTTYTSGAYRGKC